MKKTLRIGKNRSKARIWIEGQALAAEGWERGDEFYSRFDHHNDEIVYSKPSRSTEGRQRKVAGTDVRPIIDTNTNEILDVFGEDATHVDITVGPDEITIRRGHAPTKKVAGAAVALALAASTLAAPFISQFKAGAKRILVACEESGKVRDELTALGHDAVSCDILDTRSPYGWHITGDVTPYLSMEWDEVYAFPPCTYLTVSAAYAFKDPDYEKYPGVGYHQKLGPDKLVGKERREARADAIEFVKLIWDSSEKVVIENPKGFLSSMWRKPDQIIQPYWFGDPETKETCLWLKNASKLTATNMLSVEENGYQVSKGKHAGKWRWKNQSPCGGPSMGPVADRGKVKSVTYDGIAHALATQITGKA